MDVWGGERGSGGGGTFQQQESETRKPRLDLCDVAVKDVSAEACYTNSVV